jgi:hypothetical protein
VGSITRLPALAAIAGVDTSTSAAATKDFDNFMSAPFIADCPQPNVSGAARRARVGELLNASPNASKR